MGARRLPRVPEIRRSIKPIAALTSKIFFFFASVAPADRRDDPDLTDKV